MGEPVFYGEFQHILDVKNRIIIPAKFRLGLGESFILTKGWDKCLTIYTMEEWRNLENKIKELPRSDEKVRRFVRIMFGGACECEPDAQGRVLIPGQLREYAGINKEIISVGVLERIEIWSRECWDEYNDANHIDNELAMRMSELGI